MATLSLVAILAIAIAVRAWGASERSYWFDEAFCVRLIQFDWGELCARAAADNHPPLFFAICKLWATAFGTSSAALRWLDILLGVGSIGVVFAIAHRIYAAAKVPGSPMVPAAMAAAWVALHPTHVVWSAQVRMYALAALLAASSALLLLRALERPSWRRWAAWTLVAIALIYTHYFGAFVVLAQGLHAIACAIRAPAERRRLLIRVLAAGLAITLAFAPWLHVVIEQSSTKAGQWWVPPLSVSRLLHAWVRVAGFWTENEFERPAGAVGLVAVNAAGLLGVVAAFALASRDRGLRLVAWCVATPFIAAVLVTLVLGENMVLSRYLIVAEVFLPIAVVGVIHQRVRHRLAGLLLVPVLGLVLVGLGHQLPALTPRPDVPAAAAWLAANRRPDDLVVVHQYFYWTFRIEHPEGDPRLRMYAEHGKALQILGSSLIDEHDRIWSANDLASTGDVIVIDSADQAVKGLGAAFRRVDEHRFAVSIPYTELRVVRYQRR